jgi:hypothetical protein
MDPLPGFHRRAFSGSFFSRIEPLNRGTFPIEQVSEQLRSRSRRNRCQTR